MSNATSTLSTFNPASEAERPEVVVQLGPLRAAQVCQEGGKEQANGDSDGDLDHQKPNSETVLVHGTVARLSSAGDDQAACESRKRGD